MSTTMSSMFRLGDWRTSWSRTSGDASRLSAWIGRVEKKTRSAGRPTVARAWASSFLENRRESSRPTAAASPSSPSGSRSRATSTRPSGVVATSLTATSRSPIAIPMSFRRASRLNRARTACLHDAITEKGRAASSDRPPLVALDRQVTSGHLDQELLVVPVVPIGLIVVGIVLLVVSKPFWVNVTV